MTTIHIRIYLFLFFAVLSPSLSLASPSGPPSIRDERRCLPVPNITHHSFVSDPDKIDRMRTAINLLIKTETAREDLEVVKNLYENLEDKMPDKLPWEFSEALGYVIQGHQEVEKGSGSYYDAMTPLIETTVRNWLILEAYCRRYLDFSLEVELLKATTRMGHVSPEHLSEEQKKKYAEIMEESQKAKNANDQNAINKARLALFDIEYDSLPAPGYKGKASDENRKLIMDWYGQTFLSLSADMKKELLPQPFKGYSTVNPIDTNITGKELVEGKISWKGVPEELSVLLDKECQIFKESGSNLEGTSPELMEPAYDRNRYLIDQVGISLDEYCGFMLECLESLSLPEKREGFEFHFITNSRSNQEYKAILEKKKAILEEWRKNGIPEFKYLGLTELFLVDEPKP